MANGRAYEIISIIIHDGNGNGREWKGMGFYGREWDFYLEQNENETGMEMVFKNGRKRG